jgi:hypothetical protein
MSVIERAQGMRYDIPIHDLCIESLGRYLLQDPSMADLRKKQIPSLVRLFWQVSMV